MKNKLTKEEILMSEAVNESQEKERKNKTNVDVIVNENDTYKLKANFELTESKLNVISRLKLCTYQTSPVAVAKLLEEFFADSNTKPNHWLNVSQMYPPRRIYLTINHMIKRQSGGWTTIKNPAAYFTYLIKFRKKRKLTGINDTSKNHE